MSNSYVVYFLDGPKKGETYRIPEMVSYLRVGRPILPLDDDTDTARIEYVNYHVEEVDGKLFAFCEENGLGFANLVANALIEHTSGLLDEAVRQLQAVNNMLDRDDQIVPDGAIHSDVSEFLVKVRQYNE
jgi:hypothetical protein